MSSDARELRGDGPVTRRVPAAEGATLPRLRAAVAGRPAFAVGAAVYTWDDVARAAAAWSDWAPVERRAREAVAWRLQAPGVELSRADFEAAARRFRLSRRLLAADELRAWLERWAVRVDEWQEYVRASLLRERLDARHADAGTRDAPPEDVDAFAHVEAVCSGGLESAAGKLAGRAAVFAREGGAGKGDAQALEKAFGRFRDASVTPEALGRELESHRLDWVRVEVEELALAEETAAREAVLALREEGRAIDALARDAGTEVRRSRSYLGELDASLAQALVAAADGDVVGPLQRGGEHLLLRVVGKAAPALADPAIRAKAEEAVVRRAVGRETANRVRWHEPR